MPVVSTYHKLLGIDSLQLEGEFYLPWALRQQISPHRRSLCTKLKEVAAVVISNFTRHVIPHVVFLKARLACSLGTNL